MGAQQSSLPGCYPPRILTAQQLDWCARVSVSPRQAGSRRPKQWPDLSPYIHATQVIEYMMLVDGYVLEYFAHEQGFRLINRRLLQQHQLCYADMTWNDTIQPLLQLNEWNLFHATIMDYFIRFRLAGESRRRHAQQAESATTNIEMPLIPINERHECIMKLCAQLIPCNGECDLVHCKCVQCLYRWMVDWDPESVAEMISCCMQYPHLYTQTYIAETMLASFELFGYHVLTKGLVHFGTDVDINLLCNRLTLIVSTCVDAWNIDELFIGCMLLGVGRAIKDGTELYARSISDELGNDASRRSAAHLIVINLIGLGVEQLQANNNITVNTISRLLYGIAAAHVNISTRTHSYEQTMQYIESWTQHMSHAPLMLQAAITTVFTNQIVRNTITATKSLYNP